MAYDPASAVHTVEEQQDVEDRVYSVRISVQDGAVVAGSFTISPGQEGKASDPEKLSFATLARKAFKGAPKSDKE